MDFDIDQNRILLKDSCFILNSCDKFSSLIIVINTVHKNIFDVVKKK